MSGSVTEHLPTDDNHKLMAARARAAASRHMAGMEFSERTRKYFELQAMEWEQRAENLAAACVAVRMASLS